MKLPESAKKLIGHLAELPSIGPRQAVRLAFHLVNKGRGTIHDLARALDDAKEIKTCERCFFIHGNSDNLCDICRSRDRDQGTILVVEKETDLLSLENTEKYKGRYFIVGPIPKVGMLSDYQKLRLQTLKNHIERSLGGSAQEIILGFNHTSVGDFNASLIAKELAPYAKKISRLGRGLPTGGEIEFADDETLGSALERRS